MGKGSQTIIDLVSVQKVHELNKEQMHPYNHSVSLEQGACPRKVNFRKILAYHLRKTYEKYTARNTGFWKLPLLTIGSSPNSSNSDRQ